MAALQSVYKDLEDKMKRALGAITKELAEIRGGRASPAFVEHVTVDYYGAATPLKQLAAVTAPEARLLVIQPWDAGLVSEIEKAVQKAGLGITPVVDGKVIRLPIPPLTMERRNDLTKLVHKVAEEGRVNMRTLRRDANEHVKKLKGEKQLSEDESFKGQEHIQQLTDRYIEQINGLVKSKEQELQSV
jgi:ribosome recycling factor